jgi:pyridoxine kinase
MNILSIQSRVAYGHVGNSSAVFPLQRLGAEVWAVDTVQFSNHPGYGAFTGQVFSGEQVASVIEGIAARGVFARCDAVLSGYMGDPAIGAAITGAVAQVKQANPSALYCCDPVIGDDGPGIYVRPGIDAFLRQSALPLADIATPNRFELEHLTGLPTRTLAETKTAIIELQAMGPRIVLVTSLHTEDTPAGQIDMLAAEAGDFHLLRTPALAQSFNGAGDAIAALFLFHRLDKGHAAQALSCAGSAIHGLLRATEAAGSRELLTVAAQQEFIEPSRMFAAIPC